MRKIIAYKNYYKEFMAKLSQQERDKLKRALLLFETEDRIPRNYISYIRDGVYEFRVTYGKKEFRLFCIYDGDTIVVLFNCDTKKTQKAPKREIDKAIKLKENTRMKENEMIYDISKELEQEFGPKGSASRKAAEDKAWEEYNAQLLLDARKNAGLTQQELAERIGANKGYVSRLERGLTIPTVSTLYRIAAAMGLVVELRPASS